MQLTAPLRKIEEEMKKVRKAPKNILLNFKYDAYSQKHRKLYSQSPSTKRILQAQNSLQNPAMFSLENQTTFNERYYAQRYMLTTPKEMIRYQNF